MCAINFEDLKPEEQERVRAQLDDDGRELAKKVRRSHGAKTRLDTGADFEGSIDQLHTRWEFQKWGRIRRNHPPVKWFKGRPTVTGSADVDRSGWISVDVGYPGSGQPWTGIPWFEPRATKAKIIVAFDAKVLGMDKATYQHDVQLQHQLHSLRDAARAGEYAFLLILARQVGLVFALAIEKYFAPLVSREGVKLYERAGDRALTAIPHVAYGPEWSYIPLLKHCAPR